MLIFPSLEFCVADCRLPGSTAPATPIAPNASNTARREVARERGLKFFAEVAAQRFGRKKTFAGLCREDQIGAAAAPAFHGTGAKPIRDYSA